MSNDRQKYASVLDADGKQLSPTRIGKAWHMIRRKYATLVSENPMTIKLAKSVADEEISKEEDPKIAYWVPETMTPRARAMCTNCGFKIEPIHAVETGWSNVEYVNVKYKYCPMCGYEMRVHGPHEDPEIGGTES